MPKYYFVDIGFRNFLINRFEFIATEFGILFENFISKKGYNFFDIKFYRTKNGSVEVDFILDLEKKAYELKYKDKIKDSDLKGLKKFKQLYLDFETKVINKNNFYSELLGIF